MNLKLELVPIHCPECGAMFAMAADFIAARNRDDGEISCPNGHVFRVARLDAAMQQRQSLRAGREAILAAHRREQAEAREGAGLFDDPDESPAFPPAAVKDDAPVGTKWIDPAHVFKWQWDRLGDLVVECLYCRREGPKPRVYRSPTFLSEHLLYHHSIDASISLIKDRRPA